MNATLAPRSRRYFFLLLFFSCFTGGLSAQTCDGFVFDGVDDYAEVRVEPFPQGKTSRTIEAWVRLNSGASGTVFSYGTNPAFSAPSVRLDIGTDGSVDIGTGSAGTDLLTSSPADMAPVNDGQWHHIAFTYAAPDLTGPINSPNTGDQTFNVMRIYVDGVEVASKNPFVSGQQGLNTLAGNGLALIGATIPNNVGTITNYFDGEIGEVRVWDFAKTAAEVIEGFASPQTGNEPGLLALYVLDNACVDVAGLGNFYSTGPGPRAILQNADLSSLPECTVNTLGTGLFDVVIPAGITEIKATAIGASGGGNVNAPAGTGGEVMGTFAVSQGDVIRSIVGSRGLLDNNRGGGGGGTGIILCPAGDCANAILLLVAGGGGGAASNVVIPGNLHFGEGATAVQGSGNGGAGDESAGGGGFLSDGGDGNFPRGIGGKKADFLAISPGFENTGRGQGFGAGGPQYQIPRAGGGGGGYTGGDGVASDRGGKGGSNFVSPTALTSTNNAGITGGATSLLDGIAIIDFQEPIPAPFCSGGDYFIFKNTTTGVLSITDQSENGDELTISEAGGNLSVSLDEATRTYLVAGGPTFVFNNFSTPASIDLSGVNTIEINGTSGDDVFEIGTFDNPIPALTIKEGTGTQAVNVSNDLTVTNTATISSNGTINFVENASLRAGDASLTGIINPARATRAVITPSGTTTLEAGSELNLDIAGPNFDEGPQNSRHIPLELTGNLVLNDLPVNVSGAYVPVEGDVIFVIAESQDNEVTGKISIGGTVLNQGDPVPGFNGSTANFFIDYAGGDGNDVVIYSPKIITGTLTQADIPTNSSYIQISGNATIPAGEVLQLGTLKIPVGASLTVDGDLEILGATASDDPAIEASSLEVEGALTVNGNLTIDNGSTAEIGLLMQPGATVDIAAGATMRICMPKAGGQDAVRGDGASVINNAGTFQGRGRMTDVSLNSTGTVNVGCSPGVLAFTEALDLRTSLLIMEVDGAGIPGEDFDQLQVDNTLEFGGDLDLTIAPSFATPAPGTMVPLAISTSPVVGTFANVSGLQTGWRIRYNFPNTGEVCLEYDPVVGTSPEIVSDDLTGDPVLLDLVNGTDLNLAGAFTPGAGPHTIDINWGDGTTNSATVDESGLTYAGSHTYANTGVYLVELTITDGNSQTSTYLASQPVLVYSPSCGSARINGTYFDPTDGLKTVVSSFAKYGSGGAFTSSSVFAFFRRDASSNVFDRFESTSLTTLVVSGTTATITGEGRFESEGPGAATHTFSISFDDVSNVKGAKDDPITALTITEIATGTAVYNLDAATNVQSHRVKVFNTAGCRWGELVSEDAAISSTVFPNPFDKSLFVEFSELPQTVVELRVTNSLGQEVYRATSDQIRTKINLSQVPAGVYFLQTEYNGVVNTTKLIKN
ncbi:MAG: LamG-like jellyroll fold domain-containing protein [Bacteroidota bacterium]